MVGSFRALRVIIPLAPALALGSCDGTTPNTFWVDLAKLELAEGAAVKKLPVSSGEIYGGEVSGKFQAAEPFAWLPDNT